MIESCHQVGIGDNRVKTLPGLPCSCPMEPARRCAIRLRAQLLDSQTPEFVESLIFMNELQLLFESRLKGF
jgi:hypothetical protein